MESIRNADGQETVLSVKPTGQKIDQDEVVLQSTPFAMGCDDEPSKETFVERYVSASSLSKEEQAVFTEKLLMAKPEWEGAEVRTLIAQGPTENRIDLTIVGDGYTEEEKARFFSDARGAQLNEKKVAENTQDFHFFQSSLSSVKKLSYFLVFSGFSFR